MADVQGTVKIVNNAKRAICLLKDVTATNSPPSGASAGVAVHQNSKEAASTPDRALGFATGVVEKSVIFIASTAGSGVMSVTARLWGYLAALGQWVPIGTGSDSLKGVLNGQTAIGETVANGIRHAEPFFLAGHFDRLYLEVTAISGTSTAVDAWITAGRDQVNY